MTGRSSDNPNLGIAMMVFAVLFIAIQEALAKYLAQTGMPVLQVIWVRYAGHVLVMLILFVPRLGLSVFRSNRPMAQIGRSLLLLMDTGLYFFGLLYLSLVEVTALVFTAPILVVLLAGPLLKERVGLPAFAAASGGFAGVLIIVWPFGDAEIGLSWPALLIIGAALCIALFNITTRRMKDIDRTGVTMVYTALTGFVASSLLVPFDWVMPEGSQWVMMAAIGVMGACGHGLLILAHERAPASTVAPFMYVQIIWALGLGWLVFGDLPGLTTAIGAAIIIISGLFLLRYQQKTVS